MYKTLKQKNKKKKTSKKREFMKEEQGKETHDEGKTDGEWDEINEWVIDDGKRSH